MIKRLATAVLFIMVSQITMAQPIVTDSTSRSSTDSTSNSTITVKFSSSTAVTPVVTIINGQNNGRH